MDVFALDVGGQTTTAWVGARRPSDQPWSGIELLSLVDTMAMAMASGVALGIEAPLFLPAPLLDHVGTLTRKIDTQGGSRPWNIIGGAYVTANALPAVHAILTGLAQRLGELHVTTDENEAGSNTLLVWEAFVSGPAKRWEGDHLGDAALAAWAFEHRDCDEVLVGRPRSPATVELNAGGAAPLLNVVSAIARTLPGITVSGDDQYLVVKPTAIGSDDVYCELPE